MTANEYNRCVRTLADGLYRFILGQVRHSEDARDAVQNAFEVLWRKREDIAVEKAKSFLYTVAYRDMIDEIRKKKRIQLVDNIAETARVQNKEVYTGIREVLQQAMEKLPEIQRTVIMLRDYEGYPYKDIGEITGLNESQVKVYIFRARKALQKYIVDLHLLV